MILLRGGNGFFHFPTNLNHTQRCLAPRFLLWEQDKQLMMFFT
jgi:hypothetical protein